MTKSSFGKRLKTMTSVDFRRMFTSSLFYIFVGIAFVMPILILVMTTMMDGSVSVNPQTGEETVIEGFKNVWQIIGSTSSASQNMDTSSAMGITSMCNINMLYFVVAAFVCIFVSSDFRSGYCKNLFAVRAKKDDYIFSKILVSFVVSAAMFIAFFAGAMIGGKISGLPFTLEGATIFNVLCCVLSKIFLSLLFIAIFVLASLVGKQRLWLSILLSLGIGMLFFMTVSIITPLNASLLNVLLCFAGGGLFAYLISIGSFYILKNGSII